MYGNKILLKQLFKWKNLWVCWIQSAILNHWLPDSPEEALLEIFVSPDKKLLLSEKHSMLYICRFIYYLPSTLFVITSWVSFLIPPEVVPGRMALLVTLFLVLINIFNNVTAITPNTEGMTAISSWMLGKKEKSNICIMEVSKYDF